MKKIILFLYFILISSIPAYSAQIRIGVMLFETKTSEITEEQAMAITDIVIRNLQSTPSIAIVERERLRVIAMEHGLNLSSTNDDSSVIKLGQLAGCQYILLGSVTQLRQRYLSSTKLSWFLVSNAGDTNESQEATASLEARLIDVSTGRIVLSFAQSGSAIISDTKKPFSTSKETHSKSMLATHAVEAASSRLSDKVLEIIANEYPMVININKNGIRINRGRTSGVTTGTLYKVYQDGDEIFDLNGKSLGKKSVNLALLRVVNVHDNFSIVEIINRNDVKNQVEQKSSQKKTAKISSKIKTNRSGKSKKTEIGTENIEISRPILIREGDKIEAISFTEAEKLKLASQRIGEDK